MSYPTPSARGVILWGKLKRHLERRGQRTIGTGRENAPPETYCLHVEKRAAGSEFRASEKKSYLQTVH